ncbi:heparinase [Rhizobium sp. Leaf384]|uniref:heparinase II/III family protein n=1 Tax=unclassified Rhizobium TaxID=2613769 RepID=UPI000714BA9B|nr:MULTISPECIES: heparinase II/III family protein [unclassified Rhizobium]KQS76123.1 heparinase [Rhizobium sp. Leaf384]KQS85868.1 heparinase [Rhizobium sp. Leaf383]
MRMSDNRWLIYLYAREAWWRVSRRLVLGRVSFLRFSGKTPDRLIVAPTDLRVIDPHVASEIVAGRFPLAGRILETDGESPFEVDLPSREFAVRLHTFSWARHIRALSAEDDLARSRQLVSRWMATHGRLMKGIAWEPDVAAQRLIAWLSHSPVILKQADHVFYRRFLKSLAVHVRYLRHVADAVPDGEGRLRVRVAIAFASVAMPASGSAIRRAARHLDLELDRQILPDGGHVSRNPRIALDLLLDLLPLRQTYVNLGHDVPVRLIPSIDRMFPALRFFRHQGGELALFNGATSAQANELMSVLRYDETAGQPFKGLPDSQYERLAAKDVVVVMDTGRPISAALSRNAHAGCLSFELSSGRHRFIINSGAPRFAGERYRQMARLTAAHSTVTVEDRSSARLSTSDFLGPIVTGGVSEVVVNRSASDGGDTVVARHNGYVGPFGLIHERDLSLNATGTTLRGRDRMITPEGADPDPQHTATAVARFHIHPSITIRRVDANEIRLVAPDNDSWVLTCRDGDIALEEDIFFADPSGLRKTQMLTIGFSAGHQPEIQWILSRRT